MIQERAYAERYACFCLSMSYIYTTYTEIIYI